MIFLNPAVLFGLLAASIPVLIHLLNLRKLKRIEFSTLAFLKELQKNKIRKIKLKQWLLLALRILLILFLVTAFARPTLKGVAIGGTTSAAKTTAVFILDNTPSMSVVDAKGSYLNQAKAVIKELLSQLQEGDDAALVLVSDQSKDEIKTTTNLADFQKQIDEVKISDASGYLNSAIIKAAKIVSQSQNFNKEIYILSDFQQGRLADKGSLSDLSQLLNDKVRIYSFDFTGKDAFNIGIDNLKLNTQIFEINKPVDFAATVTNYSSQSVNNLVVSLFVNGERSAQQSVSLNAGESKIVSMEAPVNASGYVDAFTEIEDDDILQDNKKFVDFYIPKEIPVLILTDDPSDSRFINFALTAASSSNGQESDGGSLKITQRNLSEAGSINLSQYDVIAIIGSENLSGGLDRLNAFVDNGGSVLLMPGSKSTLQSYQKITSRLNIPSPIAAVGNANSTSNNFKFDKIDFNHPVFQDIFTNKEKKNVESPSIYYYFKINPQGKGENIISLADGSSFLSEYKTGKGKIFLFNTAPILSWGSFPVKSIFAPLMNKSIYYLASKDQSGNDYLAGSTVLIDLKNNTSPQIKIVRPDKSEDFVNLQDQPDKNYYEYKKTDLAGNYKVFSGSGTSAGQTGLINEFSVNVDPLESVTKYISTNEFENYLKQINFKGKYIKVDKNEDPAKIVLQSRFGSELWRYFLLIAIILAIVEMTVARNAKKELIEATK
ncbi:MAG: BatA domain-containing protein [Bacteroidetes bacterium]|nr:BatA domain-containing protein [Bacteroidota bacterium]